MCRTPSIPTELVLEVVRLHGAGLGRRRIAKRLEKFGIWTTKSSVDRLIRGLPPYHHQRTS